MYVCACTHVHVCMHIYGYTCMGVLTCVTFDHSKGYMKPDCGKSSLIF